MSLAARVLNRAWGLASGPGRRRFASALRDPGRHQRARLLSLVRRNAGSAFGMQHRFASVRSADDLRERVPLQDWSAVAPWVERIRQGEAGVLTCEPVIRLVPTGGSAGGLKLIPWTRSLGQELQAGLAPWITDLQRAWPQILDGPAYWSITPAQTPPGAGAGPPVGFDDDSAYLGGMLAQLVRPLFAVPSVVRSIPDMEAFLYASARLLVTTPQLRLISVWHPSFLTLVLDALVRHRPALQADVEWGGLSCAVPAAVRTALGPRLRPDPRRARVLRQLDWSDARALWPHLAVVSCWGDGPAAAPSAALAQRLPGISLQAKGLLATEGIISLPWQGRRPAAVTSHVLEFIDDQGRARWIDELASGGIYEVALTTGGGLWRYRIGDRVRVDGHLDGTPCLSFLGRGGQVCDLVGEKLEHAFVAACLAQVLPSAGFALVAPNADGSSGYTLFSDQAAVANTARLEAALAANPQWRHARDLGQLRPLRAVQVAAAMAARIWIEHRARTTLGAVKPAALDGDRGWEERLRPALEEPCLRG